MDAQVVGLSLTSALASPSLRCFDQEVIEQLLIAGERGALEGIRKEKEA